MKKLLLVIGLFTIAGGGYWLSEQQTAKNFTATSTSGYAPLTVNFVGNTEDDLCGQNLLDAGSVYKIDFGDGEQSARLKSCSNFSEDHTYIKSGSYTSLLVRESYSLNMLTQSQIKGSMTITVSNP